MFRKNHILFNRIKSLFSDIEGQAMVMVAVFMAVLLGFGAFSVDMGNLYVQRRQAQNVADAAALAGTWVIDGGDPKVKEVAGIYAEDHGMDKDDIDAYIVDDKFVETIVNKNHDVYFMRFFGFNSKLVTAKAKATRTSIWIPGHKDVLPLGLIGWEEIFYKVIADDLQNKDDFYELFKDNKHELNYEFGHRPGILKSDVKNFLLDKYPTAVIYVEQGGKDFSIPDDETNPNDRYPEWSVEQLLQTDINVYRDVLQMMIDDDPDVLFDILFGTNSMTGSFGFIDLENPGAAELRSIIDNGFKGEIDEIQAETGFISNVGAKDGPLDKYIKDNGGQAYIFAILPGALKGGKWEADGPDVAGNFTEYLVLHVVNMNLEFKTGMDPRLTGRINKIFDKVDDINSNDGYWEEVLQSWLVE
ncbi:pilus assembly protein TadG-related protein [Gudongella sp. SC589]|uniref:pilus assembly protein TadG-related protein n=1 Tax=Gudongella sp. SC589 TaxID=3385990 RepID=UPI0039049A36